MSRVRTVFANMSWLMFSQIITSVCAFVWTILTARYLGVSDYGLLGTATSFATIFGVCADLGVTTYIVRSISTDFDSEKKYLGNAIGIKLILAVFYLAVVSLALFILGWDNYTVVICFLFAVENVIKSFQTAMYSSFQAHEMMKYQAITNTLLNVLTFIFIVAVTFTNYGLWGITLAYIAANLIGLVYVTLALSKKIIVPKPLFDKAFCKKLVIGGLPFALTSLFYMIYYSIDMVMITQFSTTYATGLYNSSYKLINVLTLFYTIYTSVIFPVMSKLFKQDGNLLQFSFVKSIKYLSMVTIPIAIATFFYGGDVISLCYGNQYAEAGEVLKILIWTVCFLFINGACSMILNASHRETAVTKIYCLAALFNVALNFILIPHFSVYGASVATVISEILILALELYTIYKINQLPDRHLLVDILKVVLCASVMGVVLHLLNLNLWLAIPVGVVVYLIAIILTKTFDDQDKLIFKRIVGK